MVEQESKWRQSPSDKWAEARFSFKSEPRPNSGTIRARRSICLYLDTSKPTTLLQNSTSSFSQLDHVWISRSQKYIYTLRPDHSTQATWFESYRSRSALIGLPSTSTTHTPLDVSPFVSPPYTTPPKLAMASSVFPCPPLS